MQHVYLEVILFSHEVHSAKNLAAFFKESLGKCGLLEKFSYVVRDNAHNMSAAMEKADFKDVSCLAHTLQLVIKDSVFNQKRMIQDEPTRWNSTLHMLKRVLEQKRRLALVTPGLTPVKAMTEILSLFENATLTISYQNINVGETIPIINSITASLKENCTLKGMTNDLLASLQRKFGNCEFDQCHATVTTQISRPRFLFQMKL
ncbi:hypothetical protein PR048_004135 [Dryococelus australis]|uniref:Uncharacterized protein n=1 Tax=Dryococelus australis TaxID=614101 RepID=A0ABQ9I530_9NEOP|nr:hypothetical protein PR048_004135 [Dryococelus australis]